MGPNSGLGNNSGLAMNQNKQLASILLQTSGKSIQGRNLFRSNTDIMNPQTHDIMAVETDTVTIHAKIH